MFKKLSQLWKITDVRNKLLSVLGILIVFRIAAAIPIPGADVANLRAFFQGNQIFGLMNIFSGGGLSNFSIVAMGVAPYITASIIFQLLVMIIPRLETLSKEGEYGRQKINQYTRYLTVPLAALQAYGLLAVLRHSPQPILGDLTLPTMGAMILTLTAGTVFLMWLGELISEKHVGNGVSVIIFAGIVSSLTSVFNSLQIIDASQIFNVALFAAIGLITVVLVVMMSEGQRNIPVTYARAVRGRSGGGSIDTHLPIRINQAGVIPIIFAISVILFPSTIAQFMLQARSPFLVSIAHNIINFFSNELVYAVLYFLFVIGFTYFYTSVIFKPDQIAENLQKQGGFIPGIRPGAPTAEYLGMIVGRIVFPGALFLGLIAILPIIVQQITGLKTLIIGGTSLLIVVSVALEIFKQIQAQLTMRDYEDFL